MEKKKELGSAFSAFIESELLQELEDFQMCDVCGGISSSGDILQILPDLGVGADAKVGKQQVHVDLFGSFRWGAC